LAEPCLLDCSGNIYHYFHLFIPDREGFSIKMDLKEILFWIFLVFSLILIIWYVFGNSPTEFIALTGLIFTVLLKTWSVSDKIIKLETKFNHLAQDFKEHTKKR